MDPRARVRASADTPVGAEILDNGGWTLIVRGMRPDGLLRVVRKGDSTQTERAVVPSNCWEVGEEGEFVSAAAERSPQRGWSKKPPSLPMATASTPAGSRIRDRKGFTLVVVGPDDDGKRLRVVYDGRENRGEEYSVNPAECWFLEDPPPTAEELAEAEARRAKKRRKKAMKLAIAAGDYDGRRRPSGKGPRRSAWDRAHTGKCGATGKGKGKKKGKRGEE